MNRFLAILTALATVACAEQNDWRIVGGSNAGDGQFPYQVSLQRNNGHSCGGSILNENWILTAAHCLYGVPGTLTVVVGTNKLSGGGTRYGTVKSIYHQNYNPSTIKNDIGLVKVSKPIVMGPKVNAIEPNLSPISDGATVVLSGWGMTSSPGSIPDNLQTITLKALSVDRCNQAGMGVSDTQVCTLTKAGEGACMGDSGGPLTFNGRVAGIVSFGRPCARGVPDVFTRVSSFSDWISSTIQQN